jgi:hypothetical protein
VSGFPLPGFKFQPMTSVMPQWSYAFSRFGEGVKDWRPVFKLIAEDYRKGEIEQFATQGGSGSGGWKQLSEKYGKWKEEQKPGTPLLVFNGFLRKAAINPKVEMTKDSLTLTIDDSTDDYQIYTKTHGLVRKHKPATAAFHQEGTKRGLPARPVIQLSEAQVVRWRKYFHSFLLNEDRGNWGGSI